MGADPGELVLEIERVISARRAEVFAAFTTADEVARWWGPAGFSIPSLDFEPRAGGSCRIEMQPPAGDAFYLRGALRAAPPPAPSAFTFTSEYPAPDDVETVAERAFR